VQGAGVAAFDLSADLPRLGAPAPKRRRRRAAKKTAASSNGRRRGKYQERLLEHVKSNPEGVTAAQITEAIGGDPKQPYVTLKKAIERGEITKEDKLYKPVA
jgi:hypothetical protein